MRPLEANQHLLRVRKVRETLFLQRNIIRFYEDLQSSICLETSVARARRATAACRRAELQREATDSVSVRGLHTNGSGGLHTNGSGGQLPGARARDGVRARDGAHTLSFAIPWRRDSRQEDYGAGVGFGLSAAPPDWDARDGARGGVWEIHVPPTEPAIPNSSPASALEQLGQYTRERQQYMLALPTPLPSPRSHGDALGDAQGDAQGDALRTFSSFRQGRRTLHTTDFGADRPPDVRVRVERDSDEATPDGRQPSAYGQPRVHIHLRGRWPALERYSCGVHTEYYALFWKESQHVVVDVRRAP